MLTTPLLIIWILVNLWGYKLLKCLHLVWRGDTRQKLSTCSNHFLCLPFLQGNVAVDLIVEQFIATHLLYFSTHTAHSKSRWDLLPFGLRTCDGLSSLLSQIWISNGIINKANNHKLQPYNRLEGEILPQSMSAFPIEFSLSSMVSHLFVAPLWKKIRIF